MTSTKDFPKMEGRCHEIRTQPHLFVRLNELLSFLPFLAPSLPHIMWSWLGRAWRMRGAAASAAAAAASASAVVGAAVTVAVAGDGNESFTPPVAMIMEEGNCPELELPSSPHQGLDRQHVYKVLQQVYTTLDAQVGINSFASISDEEEDAIDDSGVVV